jgi:serine/threonine protein kinase
VSVVSPQFSKYRLIAELGRGGMATVYLAISDSSGGLDFSKLVVIKRLREHVAADPDFVVMLQDEGRLAARLNHQNVIQTVEVGEFRDEIYLAMEFLDGQPLHRIQRRAEANFPLNVQLTILCDVLAGAHYAHELRDFDGTSLNIIHRDITPHNVFVTYEGQIKVLDFGIAKAEGRTAHTKHGVVKGKLAYMAPEQARGLVVDRRTDIFSVGVMLYEAATGRRFWEEMSESEILRALFNGKYPSSPRERVASVDGQLDAICRKALALDLDARYATADDFQADLEEFMQAKLPRVRPRRIGVWLSELFADRRAATQEIIEAQIDHVRKKPSAQEIVRIDRSIAGGSTDEFDIDIDDGDELGENDISSNETRIIGPTESLQVRVTGATDPAHGATTSSLQATFAPSSVRRVRYVRIAVLAVIAIAAFVVASVVALMTSTPPPGSAPRTSPPSTLSGPGAR